MDTLILILGTVIVPLLMVVLAVVFGWRYRLRVEAAMRGSVADVHSLAEPAESVRSTTETSPTRVPLRLQRMEETAIQGLGQADAAAWHRIHERQRPLVTALVVAAAVHFAISIMALLWSISYWPKSGRIVLAYIWAVPELVLVLIFIDAPRRLWAAVALGYLTIGAMLTPLAGGPWRFMRIIGILAPMDVFLPLAGVVLIVSRRLRPIAAAFLALLVFGVTEMLILSWLTVPDVLRSVARERQGLLITAIAIQLLATALFVWMLGRKSVTTPALILAVIGVTGLIIDVLGKRTGLVGPVMVSLPAVVLSWYLVWYLFKLFNWVQQQRFISNQVLSWYLGWGFLTYFDATIAYYGAQLNLRHGLLAVSAFVAFAITLQSLLRRQWRPHRDTPGKQLVLLRVFGSPRRAVQLLDMLSKTWRLFGSLDLIVGTDVAAVTMSPVMLEAYLHRRLEAIYLKTSQDVERRLLRLDRRLQGDGRYPINELYCFANAWQSAVVRLLPAADVVLMDLRGFSKANLGCVFELTQLVNLVPLKRILLVADGKTDIAALEDTLQRAWRGVDDSAPSAGDENPVLSLWMMTGRRKAERRFLAGRLVSISAEPQAV
jgi:hypothetical protein